MIEEIKIVGFKCFSSYELKLTRLTVLSGLNNSGKSTAIQALRMCTDRSAPPKAYLSGLGDYSEIKSDLTSPGAPIELTTIIDGKSNTLKIASSGFEKKSSDSCPLMRFVGADRFGSMVELPIKHNDGSELTVGERGEHAAHFASVLENCLINRKLHHTLSSSSTLKHQFIAWMSEIAPGVKLNFDIQKKYDSSRLEVNGKRATNAGFGISYVMPIILLTLAMTAEIGRENSDLEVVRWFEAINKKEGGLLLIENPEAHLHPKGQTALGRMLVLAASAGLQVVLETHSDHLIDGVRLGIKSLESQELGIASVKFFTRVDDDQPRVIDIDVLPNGKLSEWPKGFFDQMSLNLVALSSRTER